MKKVYPIYSKWASIYENDIDRDIKKSGHKRVDSMEEADESILYALPYGFIRSHLSEVKNVGITEDTLKELKDTDGNFEVKQIRDGNICEMGWVSDYWFDVDEIKSGENKTDKGRRIEREAYDIASQVWRSSRVELVNDNFGKDPFGFIDLMVLEPLKFIQVKSNSFNKSKYKKTISRLFELENYDLEVWVREDYKGWKFYRVREDEEVYFDKFLQVESCDKEESVEEMRTFR